MDYFMEIIFQYSLDVNTLGCSISHPTDGGLQNPWENSFGTWNEGNVDPLVLTKYHQGTNQNLQGGELGKKIQFLSLSTYFLIIISWFF